MGGAEKARLVVGHEPIARRTTRLLRSIAPEVIVATGRPEAWMDEDVRCVPDPMPDAGPLAGIAAGLAAASTPWVIVVAGDMPFLDRALLLRQVERALATGRPVLARVDGMPQPLHAVHRSRDAARALAALQAGERRSMGWLDPGEIEWLDVPAAASTALLGVNEPGELQRARRLAGRATPRARHSEP